MSRILLHRQRRTRPRHFKGVNETCQSSHAFTQAMPLTSSTCGEINKLVRLPRIPPDAHWGQYNNPCSGLLSIHFLSTHRMHYHEQHRTRLSLSSRSQSTRQLPHSFDKMETTDSDAPTFTIFKTRFTTRMMSPPAPQAFFRVEQRTRTLDRPSPFELWTQLCPSMSIRSQVPGLRTLRCWPPPPSITETQPTLVHSRDR